MNTKIDKTTIFKPGDRVLARGTFGVPASPRLFKPLKDAAEEYEDYAKLVESNDEGLSKFMSGMVFLPSEGGGRYRIVEGEEYEIRVEGKYGELFHKPESKLKKQNEPKAETKAPAA